jgi:dTDP-4-amino-4,6-dideoxygalactose transaminase
MQNKMIKVGFNKPYIAKGTLDAVSRVLKSGSLEGGGRMTEYCHQWFHDNYFGTRALLVNSCTAALEMSVILADIGPGDEVLIPSFTFVSTANAVVLRGGVPIFCDISPDTLNITEFEILQKITNKTKAVIIVHYAGVHCETERIKILLDKRKIALIEDAAQAIGSYENKKPVGTIGDYGCISFHATKNINSGEGGILLIKDEESYNRANIAWEKGTNRKDFVDGKIDKYSWVGIGSSYLPSEMTAAIIYQQLQQLDYVTNSRKDICFYYFNNITRKTNISFRTISIESLKKGNAHIFYLIFEQKVDSIKFCSYLQAHGVDVRRHYQSLHQSQFYKKNYPHCELPVTEYIVPRLVRLPVWIGVNKKYVIKIINEFFEKN